LDGQDRPKVSFHDMRDHLRHAGAVCRSTWIWRLAPSSCRFVFGPLEKERFGTPSSAHRCLEWRAPGTVSRVRNGGQPKEGRPCPAESPK
jgi:hypothetical protein